MGGYALCDDQWDKIKNIGSSILFLENKLISVLLLLSTTVFLWRPFILLSCLDSLATLA